MNIALRLTAASMLLMSQFFGLLIGSVQAQEQVSDIEQEQQLEQVENVEKVVDKIYDIVEEKIPAGEMKDRLDEKKDEIQEVLEQAQEEIKEGVSQQEAKEVVQEVKKKVYLKTYSGLTDHDSVDEMVQVEGGQEEQEKAIDTALESMKDGETGTYTVMLTSKATKDQVAKRLGTFDKKLIVEELFVEDGLGYFELTLEEGSLLGEELLSEIEEGDIPDHLLGISVIKPEVYEIGAITVAGHIGEKTQELRGMNQYKSVAYQGGLQQKKKITVGVVDTGIDRNHPDLKGNMSTRIPGYDFVNKDNDPMDDHVHGTHVAGTIGGMLNGAGVYGVNTHVELVALKICNKYGYCPSYAIYNAVKYAADKGIDVLNMSLGGRGSTKNNTTCQAIDYAIKKGVIVISAAGNANKPVQYYIPGACPSAITVGAVDRNHKRASFSNYGPLVDISAPGVGIYSSIPGGKYQSLDGTSMATPHVAGLVSAVLAYKPNLTQSQIRALLKKHSSKVTYESGKVIGGFAQMPNIMNSVGVKEYSHAYKPSGSLSNAIQEEITVAAYADEGMKVNTQHIKLRVGQKKKVVVSEAYNGINVRGATYNNIIALGIGNVTDKNRERMSIQSASNESGDIQESTIEIASAEQEGLPAAPSQEEIDKAVGLFSTDLDADIEVETIQELVLDEKDGAMIASANRVGVIDVLGLKPGVTTFEVVDKKLKKITIKVEVLPQTITVVQGKKKAIRLPSRAIVWGVGSRRDVLRNEGFDMDVGYQRKYSLLSGKQLGTYTVSIPILNRHGSKRNKYEQLHFTLDVISPRKDDQAKKQANDDSFWMSHDYTKVSVGEKVTIKLEGQGPFKMVRKTGGIIGYAGKTGAGTKIASAGEQESEEQFTLDVPKEGLIDETSLEELLSSQENPPLEDDFSEEEYESGEVTLPPTEDELTAQEQSEGVEIASAGGGTSVTLVGLKPGNEVLYVTDKKGNTKNVIVQVQETRLTVVPCVRNYRGRYDRDCGSLMILPDPTWNSIRGWNFANYSQGRAYYTRDRTIRGYEIPGLRRNRTYAYERYKALSVTKRDRRSSAADSAIINVYVENQIEDPVYSRRSRYGKKVYQTMQYTLDYGTPGKAKAVTPLSKLSTDITEVPDAFKLAGTMKMTVGDMKTVMVGSQGGKYSYRKANNKIGFIANKRQDIKIASAGEEDLLIQTPADEPKIEENGEDDLEVPDEHTNGEVLTEEQLFDIDSIQVEESEDLSYQEIQDNTGGVEIASVKGKPVTFVALRPGVSYITVKYANGKSERVKIVVSPKKIIKKSTQTLTLVSTQNLVIRGLWTKKKAALKYLNKPSKRWKGGTWKIDASSMHQEDKLYASVYNRKEKKYMYLELHTSVSFPPISTSRNALTIAAGQSAALKIAGGGEKYTVTKNTHRLGFINAPKNAIKIASAGEESVAVEQGVEVMVEIDEEELEPITIDETQEDIPTQEQLAEIEEVGQETNESDFSTAQVQEEPEEGVEIASAWKKTIYFQGLRPVKGKITIKDNKGLQKVVPINVTKKIIRKDVDETLKFTSAYGMPIRYLKTRSGTTLHITKKPAKRWRGGTWHIDVSNFQKTETLYARIYNRKERRYQWLEVDVQIKEAPPITTNRDRIVLRVGGTYTLKMAGGAHRISVSKDNHRIGFMAKQNQGVAIASAEEKNDAEIEVITDVSTDPELDALVDADEIFPTQEQLSEEQESTDIQEESEEDRGEIDQTEVTEEITQDAGVEIASAKKWRKNIPIQALRPGVSYITISDERGQEKQVKVRVYGATKTKNRGDVLRFKASYHLPIKYIKTKSGTPVQVTKKPAKRWRGGERHIDTSNLLASDTLYARVVNRYEKKYQRVEIKAVIKDIPLQTSIKNGETGVVGYEKELVVSGGLPPYTFEYDKKKVEILTVKPGETIPDGKRYVIGLTPGEVTVTVKDSHTQSKNLTFNFQESTSYIVPGNEHDIGQKEGFLLQDVVSSDGTRYPTRKTASRRYLDTSEIDENTTLVLYYYAAIDKKTLKVEKTLLIRTPATGPAGYTRCNSASGACQMKTHSKVAYGTAGKYIYKEIAAGDSFACTTREFGKDPAPGKEKACRYKEITKDSLTGPKGYTFCALQGETCKISNKASIAYGDAGSYKYKDSSKNLACTNNAFGLVNEGKLKGCWWKEVVEEKVIEDEKQEVVEKEINTGHTSKENKMDGKQYENGIEFIEVIGLGFIYIKSDILSSHSGVEYKNGQKKSLKKYGNYRYAILNEGETARLYYTDNKGDKVVSEYKSVISISELGERIGGDMVKSSISIASTSNPKSPFCEYNSSGVNYPRPYFGSCSTSGGSWQCDSSHVDYKGLSCVKPGIDDFIDNRLRDNPKYNDDNQKKAINMIANSMNPEEYKNYVEAYVKKRKTYINGTNRRYSVLYLYDANLARHINNLGLKSLTMSEDGYIVPVVTGVYKEKVNNSESEGSVGENYSGYTDVWYNNSGKESYSAVGYKKSGSQTKKDIQAMLSDNHGSNDAQLDYVNDDEFTICSLVFDKSSCISYEKKDIVRIASNEINIAFVAPVLLIPNQSTLARKMYLERQNEINLEILLPSTVLDNSNLLVIRDKKAEQRRNNLNSLKTNPHQVADRCSQVPINQVMQYAYEELGGVDWEKLGIDALGEGTVDVIKYILNALKEDPVSFLPILGDSVDIYDYIGNTHLGSNSDKCINTIFLGLTFFGSNKKLSDSIKKKIKKLLDIDWRKINTHGMIKPQYHYQKHGVEELLNSGLEAVSPQKYFDDSIDFWNLNKNNGNLMNEVYIRSKGEMGWKIKDSTGRGGFYTKDGTPISFFYR